MVLKEESTIGARSTFGEQIVSKRTTAPRYRFGTSHRDDPVFIEGAMSSTAPLSKHKTPGVTYNLRTSFGSQINSRNLTAPAHAFGTRPNTGLGKSDEPGPGQYKLADTFGRQVLSTRGTSHDVKFGRGNRWSTYSKDFKDEFSTPAARGYDLPKGGLGDAPKISFTGKAKRYDFSLGGLPGTHLEKTPGPGTYATPAALGPQIDARRTTEANFKFGKAKREKEEALLYVSMEHERALLGKHAPGPNQYNLIGSIGHQPTSRKETAPSTRFGSSDRFSEIKTKPGRTLPGQTPGPGTYTP